MQEAMRKTWAVYTSQLKIARNTLYYCPEWNVSGPMFPSGCADDWRSSPYRFLHCTTLLCIDRYAIIPPAILRLLESGLRVSLAKDKH